MTHFFLLIRRYLVLIGCFLILNCAQQGILTGGEKDIEPPIIDTLKLETPKNGTVNFNAHKIEIPFNEFVALHDINKQIIITPFLDINPNIYTKGKKVIVDFKSPLKENTTYIINFGDAIKDITEGNVLKNYNYVFSTGDFLDSMKYEIFVYDAYTKKPVKDVTVMLYKENFDSVVKKQKPLYFGKTDPSGYCKISNIAKDTYKVFVLKDANGNYLFDQKDEKIGFKLQPIAFDTDSTSVLYDTIALFTDTPSKKQILSSTHQKGKVSIAFNTPINEKEWATFNHDSILQFALDKHLALNEGSDTLSFWLTKESFIKQDITLNFGEFGIAKIRIIPPTENQSLSFNTNALDNLKPNENLTIIFSEPISSFDISKISLIKDSTKLEFKLIQTGYQKIEIQTKWIADESYDFEALPGAFSTIYENQNDSLNLLFNVNNANKYGSIELLLKGNIVNEHSGQLIVLLLQNNNVISQQIFNKTLSSAIKFDHLRPSKYELCIIFDANNNGMWDTGNYFQQTQPERIEYYQEIIDVRKGWDNEINWIIETK